MQIWNNIFEKALSAGSDSKFLIYVMVVIEHVCLGVCFLCSAHKAVKFPLSYPLPTCSILAHEFPCDIRYLYCLILIYLFVFSCHAGSQRERLCLSPYPPCWKCGRHREGTCPTSEWMNELESIYKQFLLETSGKLRCQLDILHNLQNLVLALFMASGTSASERNWKMGCWQLEGMEVSFQSKRMFANLNFLVEQLQ